MSSPVSVWIVQRSGVVVPLGRVDPGGEPDVATQVVLVGDVLGVAQDLGLGGVLLRPLPLLSGARGRSCTSSRRSGCRSGRRDSGSSTTCRRRRRRSRARRRRTRLAAAGTAGTCRRTRRRRSPRRRRCWCSLIRCSLPVSRRTVSHPGRLTEPMRSTRSDALVPWRTVDHGVIAPAVAGINVGGHNKLPMVQLR